MTNMNANLFYFLRVQMTRLNEGLSFFDAILIVPMFQIAWTFFSICTGIIYFQEYQVLSLCLMCMNDLYSMGPMDVDYPYQIFVE